jgi:energy-coupling factor transporter ATP-binding protein EcfA2
MSFKATDCILIMGQRGCGKSHLCKNLQKMWPKRVIIDTLGEYPDEGETCYSFHEFTRKIQELHSLKQESFTLVIQFDPESEVSDTEFNEILRICYYFGNIQLVIEEIQTFSTPHNLPHWLKQCLLKGRHKNLSLIFTTQRPGELNKTILSQCSHIFCGRIFETNDLNYVKSIFKNNSEELINIENRKFLYFSENGVKKISNDWT